MVPEGKPLNAIISYTTQYNWWRIVLYVPIVKQYLYMRYRRRGFYPHHPRWVFRTWNNRVGTEDTRFNVEDGDKRPPKGI